MKELAEWLGLEGCPDRGGRMLGSATELNGQVSPTLLSHVQWQLWSLNARSKYPCMPPLRVGVS
jgi:hypothetical protein